MGRLRRWRMLTLMAAAVGAAAPAMAQTSLSGSSLVLKSTTGGSTTLGTTGYLGTYLVVPAGGATVNFTVNATAGAGGAGTPHLNLAVADSLFGFAVNGASPTNYTSGDVTLPAGTYFIRNERDYTANAGVTKSFTVNNLSVNTISGGAATFANSDTDTLATAAANTYIDHYRRGAATFALSGPGGVPLLAGTPVPVYTGRNAFNFGGTVSGTTTSDSKNMIGTSPPAAGTEQYKFQQFINRHFNMIVPSNGGKWTYNEPTQNNLNMTLVDRQLNYAQSHNMRARAHNLLWGDGTSGGNQQPAWVNTLIASAAAGDMTAKTNLSNAITNRVNYYVGTNGNRSQKYLEIDVLNESLHEPSYRNIYTDAGLAGIYNQVQAAIAATGSAATIMLNEYNVLQFSPLSVNSSGVQSGSEPYANYYRSHIQSVRDAGGAMTGVGFQMYADVSPTPPSASSAMKALQNLSTHGLPLSLTEYGMAGGTTMTESQTLGPDALERAMRMMYGTPLGKTFMIWGWWDLSGAAYPPAALLDNTQGNNVITPMGTRWESLMSQWNTNTTVILAPDGTISFTGAYGDYYLSGQGANFTNPNVLGPNYLPFDMTLSKGTTNYNTTLAKPPDWFFWKTNGSGTWGTASNWTDAPESGHTPNTAGRTAYFGGSATSWNLTSGVATTVNITAPVTVNVTSPVTAGMIVCDNANSYTLGGGGAINLEGYDNAGGNVAAIYVNNGSHAIDVPLTLLDATTVTVVPPASTLTISSLQPASVGLTKSGAGTLAVNNVRAPSLSVVGGTLKVLPNGGAAGVSDVGDLTIAPATTMDLTDNDLLTSSPIGSWDGSAYTGVTGMIQSGRLMTSQPDARTGLTALGVAPAGDDVLVMYTYGGDATLDGKINIDDYGRIDGSVASSGEVFGWHNGDFNYDGKINIDDYGIIDGNINQQGLPLGAGSMAERLAAVPEPASMAIALGSAVMLLRRRRR